MFPKPINAIFIYLSLGSKIAATSLDDFESAAVLNAIGRPKMEVKTSGFQKRST
jgi:hypothetical protein